MKRSEQRAKLIELATLIWRALGVALASGSQKAVLRRRWRVGRDADSAEQMTAR